MACRKNTQLLYVVYRFSEMYTALLIWRSLEKVHLIIGGCLYAIFLNLNVCRSLKLCQNCAFLAHTDEIVSFRAIRHLLSFRVVMDSDKGDLCNCCILHKVGTQSVLQ